jgi:hypothetical protein
VMETPHHVDNIMLEGFKKYINECWGGVKVLVGVLTIATTLTVFYSILVTQAELDAAVSEIKKSMQLDRDIARMNFLNESITRVKVFLATTDGRHPYYKGMSEELKELKLEKEKLHKQMEKK